MSQCTHSENGRLLGWLLAALLLLLAIAWLSPQQLPVVLYKSALVSLGAVMAYWVDRAYFPYDRPHTYAETGEDLLPRGLAMLRRALIAVACILGLTLGL
jgi:hypothetical protein